MKFTKGQTIVFFGDSVTEGCFELYPTDYGFDTTRHPELAYPKKLSDILDSVYGKGYLNYVNAGVGGNNTRMGLERMDKDVISHSPALVIVCFALNDSLGNIDTYRDNIKKIFAKILACGSRAILLTPNMMNTHIHKDTVPCAMKIASKTMVIQNSGIMDMFIACAISEAENAGVTVCDAYSEWKRMASKGTDTTELLINRINHPNEEMHALFAKKLFSSISNM